MRYIWHPSQNYGPRRAHDAIKLIVLHYTVLTPADAALKHLCAPENEVSCHYLIDQNGDIYQLVDEKHRAWHAGYGGWHDLSDINSCSIGIELVNDGASPFDPRLMASLHILLKDIMDRRALGPQAVVGHSDIAPHRKHDPGPWFNWAELGANGLAIGPQQIKGVQGPHMDHFANLAHRAGYPINMCTPLDSLRAFRSRFAPDIQGDLQQIDMDMLCGFCAAQGIDYAPDFV